MSDEKYGPQKPNDEKLKELIVYIAACCEDDDYLGATKLNKLLFYADFLTYLQYGESITGHEYQALPQGPAPRQLIPIREQMVANGDIAVVPMQVGNHIQHRIIALRDPDPNKFKPHEVDLVFKLVTHWWDATAKELSNESHKFIGWKFASDGETIPYNVALVGMREPTPDEIAYGLTLEERAAEYK